MKNEIADLKTRFTRTKANVQNFMGMLAPIIENAQDEHLRMYFHHIFEEEEQHVDRLEPFIPKLADLESLEEGSDAANRKLIGLLQDINLETFGQHNFLEHLELLLFHFQTGEQNRMLNQMIEQTNADYLIIKDILFRLNQKFLPEANRSKASDHHEVHSAAHSQTHSSSTASAWHSTHTAAANPAPKKVLTVGSLKARS